MKYLFFGGIKRTEVYMYTCYLQDHFYFGRVTQKKRCASRKSQRVAVRAAKSKLNVLCMENEFLKGNVSEVNKRRRVFLAVLTFYHVKMIVHIRNNALSRKTFPRHMTAYIILASFFVYEFL